MIYLDHPATSWPKPPCVLQAMKEVMDDAGGNPGRSGHRLSIAAGRAVYEVRETLARFFGANKAERLIFTANATHAINTVVQTVLKPGDTVLTTSVEHNSVMRPVRSQEALGVRVLTAPCSPTGQVRTDEFRDLCAQDVRLVVLNHASNVTGHISPVADISRVARAAGALVLVDAAQTAGAIPVRAGDLGVDFIAFTGHKALQGPPGVGGLVLCTDRAAEEIGPLMRGGTGSRSDSEEQPDALPDRLESGTLNAVGIAGLGAAVNWLDDYGFDKLSAHHAALTRRLVDELAPIPSVSVFGPPSGCFRAPIVSFRVAGSTVSEVGYKLDNDYGVMCRVGLHCAPAAHNTIGTFPEGTVRFGVGPFTTADDVDKTIYAVREIARNA